MGLWDPATTRAPVTDVLGLRPASVGPVPDHYSPRGRLLYRIELRARDYTVGEIGPSKWIRWGRLMGLVEAGAIHGYWSAQMVQRVADAAWNRTSPRRIVKMFARSQKSKVR